MRGRAPDSVQAGAYENVSSAQHLVHHVPLWPGGLRAGGVVDVDVLLGDAGADQRVALGVGVLVAGGHAHLADLHQRDNSRSHRLPTLFVDAICRHGSPAKTLGSSEVSANDRFPTPKLSPALG